MSWMAGPHEASDSCSSADARTMADRRSSVDGRVNEHRTAGRGSRQVGGRGGGRMMIHGVWEMGVS